MRIIRMNRMDPQPHGHPYFESNTISEWVSQSVNNQGRPRAARAAKNTTIEKNMSVSDAEDPFWTGWYNASWKSGFKNLMLCHSFHPALKYLF